MLAKLARELPEGDIRYEPKWDGFRCIIFRDGDEVELGSRNERPLDPLLPRRGRGGARPAARSGCVIDGEVVIAGERGLDFDALSQRIHPAASRVTMLAREMPASFVAFDLLALDGRDLRQAPFFQRRAELEVALDGVEAPGAPHAADGRPDAWPGPGSSASKAPAWTGSWPSRPACAYLPGSAGHVEGEARADR